MKKTIKENKDGSVTEEYKFSKEDLGDLKVKVDTTGLEKQLADMLGDLQRTRADFENYRRQVEMQKENERRAAKLATVRKVLPLLDDVDRAILSYAELKPIEGSFGKTLKELGLKKIEAGEGVEFNPDLHEAVMAEGDGEKEVIAEVLRPGYYYESEVLRPAMVKVKKI
ncbi:nucleotide exchange factor GrpE [Candidatus Saccharibacteria bacterium]|nr:nucleotide exchange factor GrpE [Candidatus Saccharibacteria bacterium]